MFTVVSGFRDILEWIGNLDTGLYFFVLFTGGVLPYKSVCV